MQILALAPQIYNWVADELTRPMVSGLPAAIDREERVWQMRSPQQAGAVRRPPNGVNGLVFEQEYFIGPCRLRAFARDDLFLHRKRVGVAHSSQPAWQEARFGLNLHCAGSGNGRKFSHG